MLDRINNKGVSMYANYSAMEHICMHTRGTCKKKEIKETNFKPA